MLPEWTIFERYKLITKHITICRQNVFPNNWKLIYENHNSKFEQILPTLQDARDFISKREGLMFFKGKFVPRSVMSKESHFQKVGYPDWFKKKIIDEVIKTKGSTTTVAKKFGISSLTVMNYLKKDGYVYRSKSTNQKARRYGEWKKL